MKNIAWCAGLFDGEGSVGIHKARPIVVASGTRSIRYTLDLNLTMVHKPSVERFKALLGVGNIKKKIPGKNSRRVSWHWRVQGFAAAGVVETLLPYLVTKREEALLALDFIAGDKTTAKRLGVPEYILVARELAYQRMRKLKLYEWK
jgi:hypothetical protein